MCGSSAMFVSVVGGAILPRPRSRQECRSYIQRANKKKTPTPKRRGFGVKLARLTLLHALRVRTLAAGLRLGRVALRLELRQLLRRKNLLQSRTERRVRLGSRRRALTLVLQCIELGLLRVGQIQLRKHLAAASTRRRTLLARHAATAAARVHRCRADEYNRCHRKC